MNLKISRDVWIKGKLFKIAFYLTQRSRFDPKLNMNAVVFNIIPGMLKSIDCFSHFIVFLQKMFNRELRRAYYIVF